MDYVDIMNRLEQLDDAEKEPVNLMQETGKDRSTGR